MKRLSVSVRLGAILAGTMVVMAACTGGRAPASHKADHTFRLAHVLDTNHPVHLGLVRFAEEVERRTGGRFSIKIYPSGTLGSERETIEQVRIGTLELAKVSSSILESFVKEFKVLNLPYVFDGPEHKWEVLEGEIGRRILEAPVAKGFRGLCYYESGARSFYTRNRPIRTPEDLRGLKIRVAKSPVFVSLISCFDATPVPISFGELYTALSSGVVDGAENNIPSFYSNRHFEVCKYFSFDEHISTPDVLIIGERIWQRLTQEEREAFRQAAAESVKYQRRLWAERENEWIAEMEAKGIEFIHPDKAPFRAAVKPMYDDLTDPDLVELLAEIRAVSGSGRGKQGER